MKLAFLRRTTRMEKLNTMSRPDRKTPSAQNDVATFAYGETRVRIHCADAAVISWLLASASWIARSSE